MRKFQFLFSVILMTVIPFLCLGQSNGFILTQQGLKSESHLLQSDLRTTTVKMAAGETKISFQQVSGKNLHQITLEGGVPLLKATAPDLQKLTATIIVPDMEEMEVTVLSSVYTEHQNLDILPSKGNLYRNQDLSSIPFEKGAVYAENSFFPGTLADLSRPFILKDFRGQVVNFYPLQYNPVTRTLRVYSEIIVEVKPKGVSGENAFHRTTPFRKVSPDFAGIYESRFLNYGTAKGRYTPVEEEGRMLILCHGSVMNEMAPFVRWKKQKGIPVEMVNISAVGTQPAQIKSYIANYYNQNPDLVFVLLVGDAQHIPPFPSQYGDSDNTYAYIIGNDHYPEVFIGRFSFETAAHVNTMVDRTLRYEKTPQQGAAWYSSGIGIASDEGPGDNNEMDWEHMRNIRTRLMSFTYTQVAELYDGTQGGMDAPGNPTNVDVINLLHQGASIMNYTGHGSSNSCATTGLNSGDVDNLVNVDKYPFFFSVACVNGDFVGKTCFAEQWLRAKHNTNGQPTGAIAVFMSTINQSWSPPMAGQDEMNDLLANAYLHNRKRTYGGLAINGCMAMNDKYGTAGDEMTDTWTIFGDPSVVVRTAPPTVMTVNHAQVMPIGSTQFQVNCNEENALVSLNLQGEILATAKVIGGVANLSFPAVNIVDTIQVTVTAFNKMPYFGTVQVIVPNGPYVLAASYQIDDQAGNNNQAPDYGESFLLNVTLQNYGTVNANGVQAILSTTDPHLTITDNTENFGLVAAGGQVGRAGAYALTVSSSAPNGHVASALLTISDDNSGVWTSTFSFVLRAPSLLAGAITVNDAAGNNNGKLNSGETVSLIIPVTNAGASLLPSATGTLTSPSPYLTITGTAPISSLSANGGTADAIFANVVVAQGVPPGTIAELNFTATGGAYAVSQAYYLVIDQIIETFESNNFNNFPWTTGGNQPWFITTEAPYEGTYCLKSGPIQDNEESVFSIQLNVIGGGDLTFAKKVSSEAGYDFLEFYLDGSMLGSWSGNVSWSEETYFIPAGQHTLTWKYMKDYIISSGQDCAWLDNIELPPHVQPVMVSLNGQVIKTVGSAGVAQANIILDGGQQQYNLTADAGGNFVLNNVAEGTYEVTAGKWGFQSTCQTITVDGNTSPITISLANGYYDDFSFDFGWQVSGDAQSGIWVRDVPEITAYNGQTINPGTDVSMDCGRLAFVTGNGGGTAGNDDIDNGTTILTSPIFDLSEYTDPQISFYYWFVNVGGSTTPDDRMWVELLVDGQPTFITEFGPNTPAGWNEFTFKVSDFATPGPGMGIRFSASDLPGNGHLVEAAVDYLRISGAPEFTTVSVPVFETGGLTARPNPFENNLMVSWSLKNQPLTGASLLVYDLTGRIVHRQEVSVRSGQVSIEREMPAGTYILLLQNGEEKYTSRVIRQ